MVDATVFGAIFKFRHLGSLVWDNQNASAKNRAKARQKELSLADRKIGQLLDRIVDANSDTLIEAYEKRVKELESHKIEMREKIDNCGRPAEDFGKFFEPLLNFSQTLVIFGLLTGWKTVGQC